MKILDKISDKLIYEKEFNSDKSSITLVRFNANYDKVIAQHDKEKMTLRFFNELNLKRNDKLIDQHDNIYYVDEVIINQPYSIKKEGLLVNGEKEFQTTIVKYTKKLVEIPETIKQCVKIETNINIDAKNSNFDGGLANYNISQSANYNQLFEFIKLLCNNTFNVKELSPFVSKIQTSIKNKEKIEEKWYSKFFKFMGTQLLDITKQFITAYAVSFIK